MEVFVIEKWDENDLMDAEVDSVFLKENNAKAYVEREKRNLESQRAECIEEEGEDLVPHYVFRITRKSIQELK